jgi:hypothetical protein
MIREMIRAFDTIMLPTQAYLSRQHLSAVVRRKPVPP